MISGCEGVKDVYAPIVSVCVRVRVGAVLYPIDILPHSCPVGRRKRQADGCIQVHHGLTYGPKRQGLCLCALDRESHSYYA